MGCAQSEGVAPLTLFEVVTTPLQGSGASYGHPTSRYAALGHNTKMPMQCEDVRQRSTSKRIVQSGGARGEPVGSGCMFIAAPTSPPTLKPAPGTQRVGHCRGPCIAAGTAGGRLGAEPPLLRLGLVAQ